MSTKPRDHSGEAEAARRALEGFESGGGQGCQRRSWATLQPFSGLFFSSLVPPLWSVQSAGQVRDRPPRPDRSGFHHIKGASSDSEIVVQSRNTVSPEP